MVGTNSTCPPYRAGVGPIGNAGDVSVLYRVVVDVIEVTRKVVLATNGMLPEAPLPNPALALAHAPSRKPLPLGNSCGKAGLDVVPARGEITVSRRKRPDAMEMIGQYDDGVDGEGTPLTGGGEDGP
jgi:hypothetical protein